MFLRITEDSCSNVIVKPWNPIRVNLNSRRVPHPEQNPRYSGARHSMKNRSQESTQVETEQ